MYEILAYSGRYIILFLSVIVFLSLLILSKKQDLNIKKINNFVKKQNQDYDKEYEHSEKDEFEDSKGMVKVKNLLNSNSKEVTVDLYDTLTIGREDSNDLVLRDKAVSKEHAVIFRRGSKFYVEDLNSTNGTYVNGKRIKRFVRLNNGSRVQIGVCELTLLL